MEAKNTQSCSPPTKQVIVINRKQHSDAVTIGCVIFLTINSGFALVQALKHKDYDNVFYVLFMYFGIIAIYGCMRMLDRVPKYDKPIRECLKGAMLVITLSVMLSTALKFSSILGSAGLWFVLVAGFGCTLMFLFCNEEERADK